MASKNHIIIKASIIEAFIIIIVKNIYYLSVTATLLEVYIRYDILWSGIVY